MAAAALVSAYAKHLRGLLPTGRLWRQEEESVLHRLVTAFGVELAEIEERGADALLESDPRTTTELLPEWEALVGLPDPCIGALAVGTEARRAAVLARLVSLGGMNPAIYIAKGLELGFTITIEEPSYAPWAAGIGTAGELLYGSTTLGVGEPNWPYLAIIHAGDDLTTAEKAFLECSLAPTFPAHVVAVFLYDLKVLRPDPVQGDGQVPDVTIS